LGKASGQWPGGVDPEDATGVVPLVAVDVIDGELGLANAPHAGQSGGPDANGPPRLESGVKGFQVVGATDEIGVAGEQDEEWSRARGVSSIGRGSLNKTCLNYLDVLVIKSFPRTVPSVVMV
jgi:hypothetical protein